MPVSQRSDYRLQLGSSFSVDGVALLASGGAFTKTKRIASGAVRPRSSSHIEMQMMQRTYRLAHCTRSSLLTSETSQKRRKQINEVCIWTHANTIPPNFTMELTKAISMKGSSIVGESSCSETKVPISAMWQLLPCWTASSANMRVHTKLRKWSNINVASNCRSSYPSIYTPRYPSICLTEYIQTIMVPSI